MTGWHSRDNMYRDEQDEVGKVSLRLFARVGRNAVNYDLPSSSLNLNMALMTMKDMHVILLVVSYWLE